MRGWWRSPPIAIKFPQRKDCVHYPNNHFACLILIFKETQSASAASFISVLRDDHTASELLVLLTEDEIDVLKQCSFSEVYTSLFNPSVKPWV